MLIGCVRVSKSDRTQTLGAELIDAGVVGTVMSCQLDDLEPQLTRDGYAIRIAGTPEPDPRGWDADLIRLTDSRTQSPTACVGNYP